jgi:hypothetical protein
MKTQNSIKLFLAMLLFFAILSVLTSCSKSGKKQPEHNQIGNMFRAETSNGISIAAYTDKPTLHRIGDTVIVLASNSSDHWILHESPAFTKDTTTIGLVYKRVVIKR